MAWYLWVNDNEAGSNCLSEYEFANQPDRQQGFQSGGVAVAKNVNSGLRQANLIACALMKTLQLTQLKDGRDANLQAGLDALSEAIGDKLSLLEVAVADKVRTTEPGGGVVTQPGLYAVNVVWDYEGPQKQYTAMFSIENINMSSETTVMIEGSAIKVNYSGGNHKFTTSGSTTAGYAELGSTRLITAY